MNLNVAVLVYTKPYRITNKILICNIIAIFNIIVCILKELTTIKWRSIFMSVLRQDISAQ